MNRRARPLAAYTLVELMIGLTLALTVMTGVLSTYLFLGRQMARLAHQQKLETQARGAILRFAQDMRMATAITSPGDSSVTLTLPTASSTTTVTYSYTSGVNYTGTLSRTPSGGSALVILRHLGSFDFNYYDFADAAVTDFTNKVASIKKVSFTFAAQAGQSGTGTIFTSDGTLTPVNRGATPRFAVNNPSLLQ
jgi:Tfp pilus assembly protein PilW